MLKKLCFVIIRLIAMIWGTYTLLNMSLALLSFAMTDDQYSSGSVFDALFPVLLFGISSIFPILGWFNARKLTDLVVPVSYADTRMAICAQDLLLLGLAFIGAFTIIDGLTQVILGLVHHTRMFVQYGFSQQEPEGFIIDFGMWDAAIRVGLGLVLLLGNFRLRSVLQLRSADASEPVEAASAISPESTEKSAAHQNLKAQDLVFICLAVLGTMLLLAGLPAVLHALAVLIGVAIDTAPRTGVANAGITYDLNIFRAVNIGEIILCGLGFILLLISLNLRPLMKLRTLGQAKPDRSA